VIVRSSGTALVAGVCWLLASGPGCSRHAELREEADASAGVDPDMLPEAGDLPEVPDARFDDPSLPSCAKRPTGDCVGVNDFPCDFSRWVTTVSNDCLSATNCQAQGWVGARMNEDGCVSALHMDEPDDEFVACMVAALAPYRCPCGEEFATAFLGLENNGCFVSCADEFPCSEGYYCLSGFCIEK
jgi:hypothetical protein